MTLKAITLDVGNTLLFPHPSLGEVYAAVAARHGADIDPPVIENRFREQWLRCQDQVEGLVYGTNHDEALRFWERVNRAMFSAETFSDTALRVFVEDLYAVFGKASAWRVAPGLSMLLDTAREAGVRLGLISNWDLRLRALLQELAFTQWADPVLISAERGIEKPDRKLFELALQELDVPAGSVIHVGDTWQDDVVAARRCGMRAAWFNPEGRPLPETMDNVLDLRNLAHLTRWL